MPGTFFNNEEKKGEKITFQSVIEKFISNMDDRKSYIKMSKESPGFSEAQILASIAVARFAHTEKNFEKALEVVKHVEQFNLELAGQAYKRIAELSIAEFGHNDTSKLPQP